MAAKLFRPVVVSPKTNPMSQNTPNTKFKDFVLPYLDDVQDVAWFKSSEYKNVFGQVRNLDKANKLLAIVRIEYNGRKIWRRYLCDMQLGLCNDEIGLTSESIRILFDAQAPLNEEVLVVKGNFFDSIMFYWNHPFHATRISTRIGLPSLLISLVSLVLALISIL